MFIYRPLYTATGPGAFHMLSHKRKCYVVYTGLVPFSHVETLEQRVHNLPVSCSW